ncbi:hypothetical protein CFC21_094306, partial [Triticum aestivum]
APPLRGRARVR